MKANNNIVILAGVRTPMGNFQGSLKNFSAPQLGSIAIKAAVERSGLNATDIDQALMGCVLPAGLGQAPARQAALDAGLPNSTACTTINKMCASGMMAVMLAHDQLVADSADVVVAGGFESLTNTPYILPNVRAGLRMGHAKLLDHMFYDGLQDSFGKGELMGWYAEQCATKYNYTREQQDAFAIESIIRAQKATKKGTFAKEIAVIGGIENDEGPLTAKIEKVPALKPAFKEGGTVTPANSSSISDGAAALVLAKASAAHHLNAKPIAKIIGHSTFAHEPEWFTTAPAGAIKKLLEKINWSIDDVDLFEINEAFAVVAMATMQELDLPHDKVNVHGGACVLGHPVGCSGARLIVTLINALQTHGLKRGIAALCLGGGEATAMALELPNTDN